MYGKQCWEYTCRYKGFIKGVNEPDRREVAMKKWILACIDGAIRLRHCTWSSFSKVTKDYSVPGSLRKITKNLQIRLTQWSSSREVVKLANLHGKLLSQQNSSIAAKAKREVPVWLLFNCCCFVCLFLFFVLFYPVPIFCSFFVLTKQRLLTDSLFHDKEKSLTAWFLYEWHVLLRSRLFYVCLYS